MSTTYNATIRTGNDRARNIAEMSTWRKHDGVRASMFNAAGGPLDAPDVLPAGGCTSTTWTTSAGRAVPAQMDCKR
jgi:hypothetical protein